MNAQSMQGHTPLHMCAANGHVEVMQFLLNQKGCEPALACLALGSRGDAEPMLSVLSRVLAGASDNKAARATFACRPRVWAELVAAAGSAPTGIVHTPVPDCTVSMAVALAARRQGRDPARVRGAAGISAAEADAFVRDERAAMIEACRGARVILCNLFSLEGVHIAEASGAACAVLSPCLPAPRRMPAGFEEEFASAMPTLYQRLVNEQQRQHKEQQQRPQPRPCDDPLVLLVCVCVFIYICICINTCVRVCVIGMYVRMCVCKQTHTHTHNSHTQ